MDSLYLQVHKDNARNVTCKLGHQNNKYIIIIINIVKLGSPQVSYKLYPHSQPACVSSLTTIIHCVKDQTTDLMCAAFKI